MIIVNVNFEVLVEVIDSLREKGYLHFGGTGVALFGCVFCDDFPAFPFLIILL